MIELFQFENVKEYRSDVVLGLYWLVMTPLIWRNLAFVTFSRKLWHFVSFGSWVDRAYLWSDVVYRYNVFYDNFNEICETGVWSRLCPLASNSVCGCYFETLVEFFSFFFISWHKNNNTRTMVLSAIIFFIGICHSNLSLLKIWII